MSFIVTLLVTVIVASAQDAPVVRRGIPLSDALLALQKAGLRIVFTSKTVTPELVVVTEPRATSARHQLDELLAPHGLKAEEGPGGVLQVVRAKPAEQTPANDGKKSGPRATEKTSRESIPGPGTHREHITVLGRRPNQLDRGVSAEANLDRTDLMLAGGELADHAIRTVHAFPGVTAIDDFRSEFVVRASPARHVGVIVDGVETPWLRHIAPGGSAGSLEMLTGHVLEEATLRAGTLPRRYGDRLGAELELILREGSRERVHLRGAIGGINATIVGEGPLGRSGRGSWLVAARQSYFDWPAGRDDNPNAFGFGDVLGRIVVDARPGQQLTVTALNGTANTDEDEDSLASEDRGGTNHTAMLATGWRSIVGSSLLIRQRAYLVRHRISNSPAGNADESRFDEQLGYLASVVRPVRAGSIEGGVQLERIALRSDEPEAGASSWQRSGYIHVQWKPAARLSVSPGARVTHAASIDRTILTPWVLAEYAIRPAWVLKASTGVTHQLPEVRHVLSGEPTALQPERATNIDLAIEHRLTDSTRLQATVFNRDEAHILSERIADPERGQPVQNDADTGVSGSARGIELLLARRSATGLSGWVAYSFGKARHRDPITNDSYAADFDRTQTISIFGVYRISRRTTAGLTFRAGTNFPIPAYVAGREGKLFLADRRNSVRLPAYSRLDLRAEHRFASLGGHLTVFGEIVNVFNRANFGVAAGTIDPVTGEARGFTRTLLPRRATAGLFIDF